MNELNFICYVASYILAVQGCMNISYMVQMLTKIVWLATFGIS